MIVLMTASNTVGAGLHGHKISCSSSLAQTSIAEVMVRLVTVSEREIEHVQ